MNVKNAIIMLGASTENVSVRLVTPAMGLTAAVSICTLLVTSIGLSDLAITMSFPMRKT